MVFYFHLFFITLIILIGVLIQFYYLIITTFAVIVSYLFYHFKYIPLKKEKIFNQLNFLRKKLEHDIKSYYKIKNIVEGDYSFLYPYKKRYFRILQIQPLDIYKNQSTILENTFDSLSNFQSRNDSLKGKISIMDNKKVNQSEFVLSMNRKKISTDSKNAIKSFTKDSQLKFNTEEISIKPQVTKKPDSCNEIVGFIDSVFYKDELKMIKEESEESYKEKLEVPLYSIKILTKNNVSKSEQVISDKSDDLDSKSRQYVSEIDYSVNLDN